MTTYKSVSDMLRSMGVSEESIAEVEDRGTEKAIETLAKMVKRLETELEDIREQIDEQTLWWKKGNITHTIPLEAAIDILKAMRLHEEY